jgi:3-(3-hydroxy-phenyl)propionate hydroxylase
MEGAGVERPDSSAVTDRARKPDESSTVNNEKCMVNDAIEDSADVDVLVVGYGPSGATLTNLLAKRGYRVAVFDQAAQIYDKPRAITADQEIMRAFQECGLADEIAATTSPHPGTDFVGVEGQVIKRFYPAPPPNPLGWEPSWMFVQPELEATLRRGVERFAHAQVHLEHEFLSCTQTDSGVTAQFRRAGDGKLVSFRGKYLVGSDGARSAVRRDIDSTIEDLAFDEWWIVVDVFLRGPVELPARCVQYCRPSRPGTYIVGPDNLRRWEIKMLPGETPEDFQTNESVLQVLSTFVDVSQLEICRIAIYRFHALVVDQWRAGRVFLMGDAAHQMPPFLGQGLCAGIRDAFNLAWKIDGVERLGFSPRLLDTYGDERKPHVRSIVALAKSFGLIIGELDSEAARLRDRNLGEQLAAGKAETVRQKFIPGLEAGLLARDASGCLVAGAGALFVQPWVLAPAGRMRLDDAAGAGFLMVATDAEALGWLNEEHARSWGEIGGVRVLVQGAEVAEAVPNALVLRADDQLLQDWLSGLGMSVVIVRPDRYVYGGARNPHELQELVEGLCESLSDSRVAQVCA